MNEKKNEIRKIVLDILFGREQVQYGATQFSNLKESVAEVIARRSGNLAHGMYSPLSRTDVMILQEVFWDLFREKIITIGMDDSNPDYPWFRLHSEAPRL